MTDMKNMKKFVFESNFIAHCTNFDLCDEWELENSKEEIQVQLEKLRKLTPEEIEIFDVVAEAENCYDYYTMYGVLERLLEEL